MKKVLLTGAGGFIGRNLKEQLCNKYDLYAPSSKELNLTDTEKVAEYLESNRFDVIVHAANRNNTRKKDTTPYDSLDGNLRMFFNLERCSHLYDKMVYFGSGAEYDMRHYIPAMEETYFDTYIPQDSYGFSKYIMSKHSTADTNIYDMRVFGVYGKYEEWERRFVSNAICRALSGLPITLQKNIYFDYLWIDDLCDITDWFINNTPRHHHYNVCRGERIDLLSLAKLVRELLDIDCDILVSEEGWKPEYSGSNSRLLEEIGEYKFATFRDSISKLCDYYRANIEMIDPEKFIM